MVKLTDFEKFERATKARIKAIDDADQLLDLAAERLVTDWRNGNVSEALKYLEKIGGPTSRALVHLMMASLNPMELHNFRLDVRTAARRPKLSRTAMTALKDLVYLAELDRQD